MAWGVSGDNLSWVQQAQQARAADLERYQEAWQAYVGEMPDALKVKPGAADDNTKVNYVRVVVDTGVAALFGEEVRFDLDPDAQERSPAEEWLDECLRVNGKMLFLQKAAINGAVYGHVFLKFRPPDASGYPRLVNIAPEYVTVVGDPDDVDAVREWVIQYPYVDADGTRVEVRQTIRPTGAGRWEIVDERRRGSGAWETVGVALWEYDWPPMLACQNLPNPNEYYGLPDVGRDVVKLNQSINFVLSNVQRIIRFHAHPKTWAKGTSVRELAGGVDDVIVFTSAESELHTLEMASDLSSSIEYYKRLREALHEVTRTPEVATGKLDATGVLSGVALRILYGPLETKTRVKQLTYGQMLVEMARRLWEMGGFGADNLCSLTWGAVVPVNEMEERQVAVLDEQLGVSKNTLLGRLGYDADEEAEKRGAEGADAVGALLESMAQGQGAQGVQAQNGRFPERNNV